MPRLRATPGRQVEAAIEELVTLAANAGGLDVTRSAGDEVKVTVGKHSWPAKVIACDAVSKRGAEELVATEARGSKVVVANQLSAEAKAVLDRQNETSRAFLWSWLDRRGELQLNHRNASGVIHFDNAALSRRTVLPGGWRLASPRSDGPIRGRAGISYAAALLLNPPKHPSVRAVAANANMSHGAVGDASKLLREAGLVRPNGEPQLPELFWSLADAWGPTRITPVATAPTRLQAKRLRANTDRLAEPGWALGGDDAAAAWGAPVFVAEGRPWIWVPTEADARRVERSLVSASWSDCSAVVAVPPTLLVCRDRRRPPSPAKPDFLPTVHPLFVALELAQDPARGREILDQWYPDQPDIQRVW